MFVNRNIENGIAVDWMPDMVYNYQNGEKII